MADLAATLAANRAAVADFAAAAERIAEERWAVPVQPGKWSPAQISDHVTVAYDLSLKALQGNFPGRTAPRLLRPLINRFFLQPVLRNGAFAKKSKAPGIFKPDETPRPRAEAIARLRAASGAFEAALERQAAGGGTTIDHPFFGAVPIGDYLRLQEIHTRHHRAQLPV